MGVSFSHGEASWSYSGWDEFQARLAEIAGIDLQDWGSNPEHRPSTRKDPLVLLFFPQGGASPKIYRTRNVADRLREVLALFDPEDINGDIFAGMRLVESLELARKEGMPLAFY